MVNPINYEEKRFIIVNDISKTLFYFFDFDTPFQFQAYGIRTFSLLL